jgi:Ca-activated chloride channel family protein
MRQLLPRAGPDGGYDVVFFLSDGEQTVRPDPRSFERLEPAIAGGAVLGYGTDEGARMRVYLGRDETADLFIHDYDTDADAVSKIDEGNLSDLAEQMGLAYVHRTEPSDVGAIADAAARQVGSVYAGERDTARRLYWLPAFGVIALVLWQLARTTIEIIDDRRALGGTSRRRRAET